MRRYIQGVPKKSSYTVYQPHGQLCHRQQFVDVHFSGGPQHSVVLNLLISCVKNFGRHFVKKCSFVWRLFGQPVSVCVCVSGCECDLLATEKCFSSLSVMWASMIRAHSVINRMPTCDHVTYRFISMTFSWMLAMPKGSLSEYAHLVSYTHSRSVALHYPIACS